ncbi:MAG: hypothetical protein Q8859_10655, partial [Bacteroidota bacterium]|nr:hypothetical protein [Bacteroidota bacterium]
MKAKLVLVFLSLFIAKVSVSQPAYPGHSIGTATITVSGDQILIVNNVLSAKWKIKDHLIQAESILDKETQQLIQWNNNIWFSISLKNGESLSSNEFKLINNLKIQNIHANSQSINRSGKDKGKKLSVDLYCEKAQLKLHWEVILKNNSNYIRQQFTLTPEDSLMVDKINLLEIPQASGVKPYGLVAGSPIVSEEIFFAFEHPMSQNEITSGKMVSFIKRYSALKSSAPLTFSVVWGVSPHNQVRRSFLYYLERERVVPYHQQLHYNSWYDLSWTDRKLDDKSCQDRIQMFGDSLITKRHTPMKAFLFDDGWDNTQTLWQFNSGFPKGFSNITKLVKKYHASLGVWISPWGGYDEAKKQRLEYGKVQTPPFETNENGFSLSGPVYFNRFKSVTADFITKYSVSMFKFDGVGAGDATEGASSRYEKDIDALLKLVGDLRAIKPDLYVSLTIGTWPSPYWLYYGDAIWRNG